MISSILVIAFIIFISLSPFLKKVPNKGAVIIDRNSHYHKQRRFGFYIFNPVTDFVTTIISTNPTTLSYTMVFETHDVKYVSINYSVTYKTDDVDLVLENLKSSRRSIYDIINSSFEYVTSSFMSSDLNAASLLKELPFNLRRYVSPFWHSIARC